MGKFKIGLEFDKDFLETLRNTTNSGVVIQNTHHHLVLHPIHLNNISNSMKDLLNEGIAKYNKNLDGILLGYQNIKLLTDKGTIHDDSCGIHMDIEADFFVLKPEIGKELQGIVNRKSKDHVGVLVYKSFNVSIPKPQEEEWLGTSVKIGHEVLFQISHVDVSNYLPYIRGELISILSKTHDDSIDKIQNISRNKKLNKKLICDDDDDEPELKKSKKKSKKIKRSSESSSEEETLKKKKKRKDHNNTEISGDLNSDELFQVSGLSELKKSKTKSKKSRKNSESGSEIEEPKKRKQRRKHHDNAEDPVDLNIEGSFQVLEDDPNQFQHDYTDKKEKSKKKKQKEKDRKISLSDDGDNIKDKKAKKRKRSSSEAESVLKKWKM